MSVRVLATIAMLLAVPGWSVAQMPDPRQMAGVPLPTGEIPAGTVTVRVIRGSLTNPVVGQAVELVGEATGRATTNDVGRAEFPGLKPGSRIRAVATVDGERLESQEFTLPPQAGVRIMLLATDRNAGPPAEAGLPSSPSQARTGVVALGDQSRFVVELADEALTVFNIHQLVNTANEAVQPAVPIVFHLPEGAEGASILNGSSPLAAVGGDRVEVKGPFPPGMTLVQFAYTLPYDTGSVTISQRLPAAIAQVAVVVQKAGEMRLSSPQLSQQRDMTAEGQTYILGQGPPLAAGSDITLTISGLPHAPVWPRILALSLAGVILLAGAYAAVRGPSASGVAGERRRLEAERERLFTRLAELETAHRAGEVDPETYAQRRRELVVALERVYAALDEGVAA